jgi:N-methylhydantoinase A
VRELDAGAADPGEALRGARPVWSPLDRSLLETPVYDGLALGPGAAVAGPAVVELANTTIVVPPRFELLVDRYGSFLLASGERGRKLAAQFTAARAAPA